MCHKWHRICNLSVLCENYKKLFHALFEFQEFQNGNDLDMKCVHRKNIINQKIVKTRNWLDTTCHNILKHTLMKYN